MGGVISVAVFGVLAVITGLIIKFKDKEWKETGKEMYRTAASILFIAFAVCSICSQLYCWLH